MTRCRASRRPRTPPGTRAGAGRRASRASCILPPGGTAVRTVGEAAGGVARLDDGELAAWLGLLQAHALVARRLDAALQESHRLSLVEHTVLERLRAAGGRMRMSDLAGSALLSPSGVSRLVDRLVVGGLIERTAWRQDGRAIYAVITEAGRRLLREAETRYVS